MSCLSYVGHGCTDIKFLIHQTPDQKLIHLFFVRQLYFFLLFKFKTYIHTFMVLFHYM